MIRFILKGLIRDRSRSLFPVLIVTAGAFLVVFFYCWLEGVMSDMVATNAKFSTGHAKIMTRAYADIAQQIPNDLAIIGVGDLVEELKSGDNDMFWTPRIRFGGILDVPDSHGETRAQSPVTGLGADLFGPDTPEMKILNLHGALVKGNMPRTKNEILISSDLAGKLDVKPGDLVTLLGSTMYGGMTMHNFTVSGMVRFGITSMDKSAVIADIRDVQEAMEMNDAASEIVGYSRDMLFKEESVSKRIQSFNSRHSGGDDDFAPVMISLRDQEGLAEYLDMADFEISIIIMIFVTVMSVVLWNSGLMNGIRRYGETGVRLALGEPKGSVYRWMIYESMITGFAGSVLGTAAGLALSYYFQDVGIDLSALMKSSTMMISNVMRARVTAFSYLIGFLPGFFAPLLGSMFSGVGIYKRETSQLFKELEV